MNKKEIIIDFLYLDLNTCKLCKTTDENIYKALNIMSDVLKILDYHITVNSIQISSKEMAEKYHFLSSPTIQINGIDICSNIKENKCLDCSDLCGDSIDCRTFIYQGVSYDQPPVAMIIDAILRSIYIKDKASDNEKEYILPDNLNRFFKGYQNNCNCNNTKHKKNYKDSICCNSNKQ